jgi:hypothetical protein
MPQRVSGAVWPFRASADFRMTNVLEGNEENLRQLETALAVRPVISATAPLPPSASMTSEVDLSSTIPLTYSKFLGSARSKNIYSPKILEAANLAVMANPQSNEEVTKRLILLRKAVSGDSQTAFATKIGIEVRRWNNFERGSPLSKEVGILLCEKIQGVSLDWLHRGRLDAVPLRLREELEAAGKATTSPGTTRKGD